MAAVWLKLCLCVMTVFQLASSIRNEGVCRPDAVDDDDDDQGSCRASRIR